MSSRAPVNRGIAWSGSSTSSGGSITGCVASPNPNTRSQPRGEHMATNDRIALITGAGSGIGRAVSVAFLKDGYRVVLAGRHTDTLGQSAALAGAAGKNALAVAADVTDPSSVHELFARTHSAFGRLDVLFNNAGITAPAVPLEDL